MSDKERTGKPILGADSKTIKHIQERMPHGKMVMHNMTTLHLQKALKTAPPITKPAQPLPASKSDQKPSPDKNKK